MLPANLREDLAVKCNDGNLEIVFLKHLEAQIPLI